MPRVRGGYLLPEELDTLRTDPSRTQPTRVPGTFIYDRPVHVLVIIFKFTTGKLSSKVKCPRSPF